MAAKKHVVAAAPKGERRVQNPESLSAAVARVLVSDSPLRAQPRAVKLPKKGR